MEFVRGGLKAKGPAGNETWSGHASNEEKETKKSQEAATNRTCVNAKEKGDRNDESTEIDARPSELLLATYP